MRIIIEIVQAISAVLLILFVLIQVRGTSFGRSVNSSSFTRRGIEKMIFKLTFVVVFIFLFTSVTLLLI